MHLYTINFHCPLHCICILFRSLLLRAAGMCFPQKAHHTASQLVHDQNTLLPSTLYPPECKHNFTCISFIIFVKQMISLDFSVKWHTQTATQGLPYQMPLSSILLSIIEKGSKQSNRAHSRVLDFCQSFRAIKYWYFEFIGHFLKIYSRIMIIFNRSSTGVHYYLLQSIKLLKNTYLLEEVSLSCLRTE
jgi:hypothetical protein